MPTEQERPGMFAPSHRQPRVLSQGSSHAGLIRSNKSQPKHETPSLMRSNARVSQSRSRTLPPEFRSANASIPVADSSRPQSVVQPSVSSIQEQQSTSYIPEALHDTRVHPGPLRSHPVPTRAHATSTGLQAQQTQLIAGSFIQNQDLPTTRDADYDNAPTDIMHWTPSRLAMIRAAITPPRHGYTPFRPENQPNEGNTDPNDIASGGDPASDSAISLSPTDPYSQPSGPHYQEPSFVGASPEDIVAGAAHYATEVPAGGYQTPPASPELLNCNEVTIDADELHFGLAAPKIPAFQPLRLYLPAGPSLYEEIFGQVDGDNDIWYGTK
jgi:hypothetical protein